VFGRFDKTVMPTRLDALPGREHRLFPVPTTHTVLGTPLEGPWPAGTDVVYVAMGCFWGAERIMWRLPGVVTTAVGYMGGFTPNPTYEESCTGRTGHTEAVLVAYDPAALSPEAILKAFWENHDPTQGMRQGNDRGTQYRSGIYVFDDAQKALAQASKTAFQQCLDKAGYGAITTEILPAPVFYYAEDYHQQYLAKNPGGYCGLGGTGVSCPVGIAG